MSSTITLQNIDQTTAQRLYAEAQKRQISVENLMIEIIKDFFISTGKLRKTAGMTPAQQYAEAYAKHPVQPDEFEIDEDQLVWGDE